MLRTWIVGLVITGIWGCATPMTSGSDCTVEPGALAGMTTFAFRNTPAIDLNDNTGSVSPIHLRQLEEAIITALQMRGFRYIDSPDTERADLEVAVALQVRRELISLRETESPSPNVDCWERIDMGSASTMQVRSTGFMTADIFYLDDPIWRGWVERALSPNDRARDQAPVTIAESVPKLFEGFPP